jgi:hypothetical protein
MYGRKRTHQGPDPNHGRHAVKQPCPGRDCQWGPTGSLRQDSRAQGSRSLRVSLSWTWRLVTFKPEAAEAAGPGPALGPGSGLVMVVPAISSVVGLRSRLAPRARPGACRGHGHRGGPGGGTGRSNEWPMQPFSPRSLGQILTWSLTLHIWNPYLSDKLPVACFASGTHDTSTSI